MPRSSVESREQIDLARAEVAERDGEPTYGEPALPQQCIKDVVAQRAEAAFEVTPGLIALGALAVAAIGPDDPNRQCTGSKIPFAELATSLRDERMELCTEDTHVGFRFISCKPACRDGRCLSSPDANIDPEREPGEVSAMGTAHLRKRGGGERLQLTNRCDADALERRTCPPPDAGKQSDWEWCKEGNLRFWKHDLNRPGGTCGDRRHSERTCEPNLALQTRCGDIGTDLLGQHCPCTKARPECDGSRCPAIGTQTPYFFCLLTQDRRHPPGDLRERCPIRDGNLQFAAVPSSGQHRHTNLDAGPRSTRTAIEDRCAIGAGGGHSERTS
jgi:hypothetical protein